MYILGVDGGGTKVHAVIGNEAGEILAEGFGGQGNYQTCGVDTCRTSISNAIVDCVSALNIEIADIDYGVFGLSGYDEPADFAVLEPLVKSIMGDVPHEVMHDSWIGMRAATDAGFGIVSICGTGGATTGQALDGTKLALRNLGYITGNRGGGGELIEHAIHYAFRSEEGTYLKSSLEQKIPECFGLKDMNEVCESIRDTEWPDDATCYKIPIAVFKAAKEGDQVATELINDMGRALGQYAAGVIRRLGLEQEAVPCTLVGSLFKQQNPALNGPYLEEVQKVAPKAYTVIPEKDPVYGALGLALDAIKK